MILNAGNILLIGSILLFVSIVVGKAGFRFGVPALLLFLGVGMLFGTDGLGIEFNNPQTAQFIGVIALSIILFRWYGYKCSRNQTCFRPGNCSRHGRSHAYRFTHGIFYLLHHKSREQFYHPEFHGIIVTRLRHVVYRFCFRVLDSPFQTTRAKRKPTPHVRAGKW